MSSQRLAAVQRQVTFRPNPDVVAQRVGTDVVLVNLRTNRIYELNRTGARLWELIQEGHDRDQIQQHLLREFDVEEAQLALEIDAFLTRLGEADLIAEHGGR